MEKINFGDKKSFFFAIGLVFILFLTSCKTTSALRNEKSAERSVLPIEILAPGEFVWEKISAASEKNVLAPSVFCVRRVIKEENVKWACVKIDLNENWDFVAEPTTENLGKKFSLQKFSKKYKTAVAVNATPFSKNGVPVGAVKINGNPICPANPKYCALALKKIQKVDLDADFFSANSDSSDFCFGDFESSFVWRAKIFSSQNERDFTDYDYVLGGFFEILDGDNIFEFKKYRTARTAVGLSDDGRFLYLFATCEISAFGGGGGLSFEECALILKKIGCEHAMQFDGGHSSGLVVGNENFIKPAFQRKISVALGLKSQE